MSERQEERIQREIIREQNIGAMRDELNQESIAPFDTADYRGATIQYEVFIYDHWEIFTNRIKFNKRRDKAGAYQYIDDEYTMKIDDMFERGLIQDAKPLLRENIHLYQQKIRRDVTFNKPVDYKVKRVTGRDGKTKRKFIEIPIKKPKHSKGFPFKKR